MKKNYLLGLILILFNIGNISAQSYYYYKNQKQTLILDKTGFDIFVNNNFQIGSSTANLQSFNLTTTSQIEKFATVEFVSDPTHIDYFSKINELKSNPNLLSIQPRFITPEIDTLRLSNYLFVKLKTSNDLSILQNIANTKKFSIVGPNQFMPLWYKLKCDKNSLGNSLEISNYLSETGLFASANPDFLSNINQNEEQVQSLVGNNPPQYPNTVCANDTILEINGD